MQFVNTSPTLHELQTLLADPELFSSLDRHFALFIGSLAKKHKPQAALAAALVSSKTAEGNICLDLAEYAGKQLNTPKEEEQKFSCPILSDWKQQLTQSGVAGHDEGDSPLVLDGNGKLYLRRYWQYENSIIRFIQQRSNEVHKDLNYHKLSKDLKKLFPSLPAGDIHRQQIAAIAAVTRSFCVICGGPGTGKTSTMAKIIALFKGQQDATTPLRILLGAPTGKAASRLQQAIADTGLLQTGSEQLQAFTLHRLLGYIPNSPYFRHNAENPLNADIIVIDEVSMVDQPLLAKLMQAVPSSARLILLGDRHQLASVQPGSVLGDICRAEELTSFSRGFCQLIKELTEISLAPSTHAHQEPAPPPLEDSFVELVQSYRFTPDSAIARLSRAVKNGDEVEALTILHNSADGSIAWSEVAGSGELSNKIEEYEGFSQLTALQQAPEPYSCFTKLDCFQILCPLRSGPFGMERINTLIEEKLVQQVQNAVSNQSSDHFAAQKTTLSCRPVMVTQNDYNLRLFNGDVGIIMPDPENPQSLRAFFKDEFKMLRDIAPALLPGHETVFAMTVHKSQGSEFNSVLLILPDQDSPLLTRELLYTAITRAREKMVIWGSETIFASAVKRCIKRTSGLAEALWG